MTRNTFRPVAIVVVNYASHLLLEQNLAGVAAAVPDAAVVVVDSHSTTEEESAVAALASRHGWTLVTTARNVGFGAGMNLGVAAAKDLGAEAFLLLNPDAVITAPSVALLRSALESSPLTLLVPKIYDSTGTVWFDGADVYLDTGETRASRHRTGGERVLPWLTGACLLVSSQLWDQVAGFDERFFLYWEDVDLSIRVCRSGGALRVVEGASAIHDEGGTHAGAVSGSRAKSDVYYYYNIRNRLLFAALNLPSADRRRWRRGSVAAAYRILLRGGRRQFLRPLRPVGAGIRGTVDGLALMRAAAKDREAST